MPLSDAALRNAKPKDKPYKLADGDGLYLLIKPDGGRYWRLKYRFAGKEKVLALGVYPEVTLAEAREARDEARRLLKRGTDPSAERKERKHAELTAAANTFEVTAREWAERQATRWTADHAGRVLQSLEADIFPEMGARPINAITAAEMYARCARSRPAGHWRPRPRSCSAVAGRIPLWHRDRALRRESTDALRGALKPPKRESGPALTAAGCPSSYAGWKPTTGTRRRGWR